MAARLPLTPGAIAALRWADMVDEEAEEIAPQSALLPTTANDPACFLAAVNVVGDGNCLFHALAYFFCSADGIALREEIIAFLEQRALEQRGFEEAWLEEAERLRAGAWGGFTAITAASLMKSVRVKVHIVQAAGRVQIIDACHAQVKQSLTANEINLLYYPCKKHYDALVPVMPFVAAAPVQPSPPSCFPAMTGPHLNTGWQQQQEQKHRWNAEAAAWSFHDTASTTEEGSAPPKDYLRCMLRCTAAGQVQAQPVGDADKKLNADLDVEVYEYVCQVLHPNAHRQWWGLALWQADLQERCADHEFASPFWQVLVYELDIGLHLEVEVFVRLLRAQALDLGFLHTWQQQLRRRAQNLWFRQRLWRHFIHHVDLGGGAE